MLLPLMVALASRQDQGSFPLPPSAPFVVGTVSLRKLTVTAVECDTAMKDVTEGRVTAKTETLTANGDRFSKVTVAMNGKESTTFLLRCDKYALPVDATVEKGDDLLGFQRLLLVLRQPLYPPATRSTTGEWTIALANPLVGSKGELDVWCSLERIEGDKPSYRLRQRTGLLKVGASAQVEIVTVLTIEGAKGTVTRAVQSAELYANGMKSQTVTYDEGSLP